MTLTLKNVAEAPRLNSYVALTGKNGLSEAGTYKFYFQTSLPIPPKGTIKLTLPSEITYAYISTVKYTGSINTKTNVVVRKGASASELTLEQCISDYLQSGLGLMFELEGLKNPGSSTPSDSFKISTFDDNGFAIETLDNGLTVSAAAGNLGGVSFVPTN